MKNSQNLVVTKNLISSAIFLSFSLFVSCTTYKNPQNEENLSRSEKQFFKPLDQIKNMGDFGDDRGFYTSRGNDGSYTSKICIDKVEAEEAKLADNCFTKKCTRKGNSEACEELGDPIVRQIYERGEKAREQDEKSSKNGKDSSSVRCLNGDLEECKMWIHSNSFESEDPLNLLCSKRKVFRCDYESEPLKIGDFLPDCESKDGVLICEEGFKGKFWRTRVAKVKEQKKR